MNTLNIETKVDGTSTLSADEFNRLVTKTNDIIEAVNTLEQNQSSGGGNTPSGGGSSSSGVNFKQNQISYDYDVKHNLTILTTTEDQYVKNGEIKGGKINIEPISDLQIKPGDDIIFYSHHREENKQNEVALKILNGSGTEDIPVKLQLNASELTVTTKGKTGNTANVFDVNVNSGPNTKGYLKVRAQAIDLRSESHGGIALQPKGYDGEGKMNKIKFEHGGGDGLEFGTFNTEKTSIFTDEYRFNKGGIWKMATRQTTPSDKVDEDDSTTTYKYVKQEDDFYDIINQEDAQTTTKDIINTAAALNNEFIETSLSTKKNLKISAISNYKIVTYEGQPSGSELTFTVDKTRIYTRDELKLIFSGDTSDKLSDLIDTKLPFLIEGDNGIYRLSGNITPKIALEAEEEVGLDAKYGDVVITSGDTVKMEAPEIRLNAMNSDKTGGTVNFGATQDIIFITKKLTNGMKVEAPTNPTQIKQVLQNNTSQVVLWNGTKFIITLKELYGKDSNDQLVLVTPNNYNTYKETNAYFSDGSPVPADYTCYCGFTTEDNGTYTTSIYMLGTKGSSPQFKKKPGNPVAVYTHSVENVLGTTRVVAANSQDTTYDYVKGMEYLEFIFSSEETTMKATPGVSEVQPESFVESDALTVNLEDIFTLVNFFKTGEGLNSGPWAPQL